MINSIDYTAQKRFIFYTFLLIFAATLLYVLLQFMFAKQIQHEVSNEITKQAVQETISTLSKEIDVEILNRVKDLPLGTEMLTKLLQDIIAI